MTGEDPRLDELYRLLVDVMENHVPAALSPTDRWLLGRLLATLARALATLDLEPEREALRQAAARIEVRWPECNGIVPRTRLSLACLPPSSLAVPRFPLDGVAKVSRCYLPRLGRLRGGRNGNGGHLFCCRSLSPA